MPTSRDQFVLEFTQVRLASTITATSLSASRLPKGRSLTILLYFCKNRNMANRKSEEQVARFADMFSARGTESRLRAMQLLLSAHPDGMVGGEIQEELDIPNSTLSHHLDKLRNEGLVQVQRESTFLRYSANTELFRSFCSSSMPSVVPETKQSNRKISCRFANRRPHEHDRY